MARQLLIALCAAGLFPLSGVAGRTAKKPGTATQPASPERKKARYLLIPVKGVIGADFTAAQPATQITYVNRPNRAAQNPAHTPQHPLNSVLICAG